jgi:hypothetical protein
MIAKSARGRRVFAAIIAVFMVTGAAAQEFTPEERESLKELRTRLESSCQAPHQFMSTFWQQSGMAMPAIAQWLDGTSDRAAHCACFSETSVKKMSPELLRQGSEQELAALLERSSTQCTVPRLKASYPANCPLIVREWGDDGRGATADSSAVAKVCECTQPSIDEITEDTAEAFSSQTIKDYASYKKTGQVPATSRSLVGVMSRCGIAGLKFSR